MQKLKLGMVGGGEGAFIGAVHRMAARLDGHWDLVAGCLSSTPEKAQRSADSLGLERSYGSFEDMATAESAREDGIDAVSIVTPNHMHLPIARAFLASGIHVICDKPLTTDLAQAEAFAQDCGGNDARFFLTHNYSASPLIRQAKAMVETGELGDVRLVHAEYLQDWLSRPADPGNVQAAWRTDPARTGGAGAIGDIGTHAYPLATFVVGEPGSPPHAERGRAGSPSTGKAPPGTRPAISRITSRDTPTDPTCARSVPVPVAPRYHVPEFACAK